MRAALRVVPQILLRWLTVLEVDVGDVAVDADPSHQYSTIPSSTPIFHLLPCDRWQ